MRKKGSPIRKIVLALVGLAAIALLWRPVQDTIHRYQIESLLNESLAGRVSILRMKSRALRRTNSVYVYTPPGYSQSTQRYPVVYLLHGCPGQGSDWFVKGRAHETAERLILSKQITPVIVVSFDGFGPGGPRDRTEFLNSEKRGVMVEDYIARELPRFIDGKFRTIRSPESRALVGLSSGGYGAVNVGTRHQDVYRVLASHSGFFNPDLEREYTERMLGPKGRLWDQNDPVKNVRKWRGDPDLHIYLDCGAGDELLADNQRLDREMTANGIKHVLHVTSGSHQWSLWRARFAVSLRYCDKRFDDLASR